MLAEVDYRVSAELLDHPPVGSEVVVGRRQVGIVVDGDRVLPEAPWRLDAHEDVSEREPSHDELVAINVQIPRRPPPVLLDVAPQFLWQPAKPLRVAFRIQASGSVPELVPGQELQIMAPSPDERVDEFVSSLWRTLHLIARLPHRVQQLDGAYRGIQSHGVPYPRVLGRVVGEQYGDSLLRVRDTPESGEACREPCEAGGAFGVRFVEGERGADGRVFAQAFLEREGDPDNAPVELRYGHLPGCVERGEAGVRGEPGLPRRGRADALYDRHAELFESRDVPLQPLLGRTGPHGVRHVGPAASKDGGDEAVYSVFHQLQGRYSSVRACSQRVAVDGQGVGTCRLQRLDECVHKGCVPAHPVCAVEDNAYRRPRRIVPREQFFDRGAFRQLRMVDAYF